MENNGEDYSDSGCDLLSLVVNDENVTDQLANNEYKFVLKKNTSITAAFQKAYRLTVEPFEHGSMRVAISDKGDLSDVPSDGKKILDDKTTSCGGRQSKKGMK